MSMQRFDANPIEQRKQAVRKYSRNSALSIAGGIGGGAVLGLLLSSWSLFIALTVVGIALGGYYYKKVQNIVNYRDPQ